MSHPTLSWPISILAGAGVILLLLLVSAITAPISARPSREDCVDGAAAYPQCEIETQTSQAKTALADTCVSGSGAYPICMTKTADAAANPSATTGSSGGSSAASTATPTPTSTATRTITPTATHTAAAASALTSTPTLTAPATTAKANDTILPTPTPLIPDGTTILTCVPDESVEIAGDAQPNTPLIVYFDKRAVGGGTSTSTGSYLLRMRIGAERPGLYLVEVRERGSRTLIQQLGCDVPALTPTATAALVP